MYVLLIAYLAEDICQVMASHLYNISLWYPSQLFQKSLFFSHWNECISITLSCFLPSNSVLDITLTRRVRLLDSEWILNCVGFIHIFFTSFPISSISVSQIWSRSLLWNINSAIIIVDITIAKQFTFSKILATC